MEKRNNMKFISMIMSFVLAFSNISVRAFESNNNFYYAEDFSAYEIMENADTAGEFTVGDWKKSSVWRGSGWNGKYMSCQILKYPTDSDNKVMAIKSFGSTSQACMNLNVDTTSLKKAARFNVKRLIPS